MPRPLCSATRFASAACGLAATLSLSCAPRARLSQSAPTDPPQDEIINTAIFGEQSGLELRWWIVNDNTDAIESAVAPYLDEPPLVDPATLKQLRLSGLRLIAIPISEVLSVRAHLPIVGRIDRQWIGEAPAWTQAVAGPSFGDGKTLRVSGELAPLRAGSLRLLTRTWTTPLTTGAAVRIDLAIQHVPARNLDTQLPSLELVLGQRRAAAGMIFESTLAQLTADGRYAILIVPERPETRWTSTDAESSSKDDSTNDFREPTVAASSHPKSPAAAPTDPESWEQPVTVEPGLIQGPPSIHIPTVGEAMLIEPEREPGAGQRRAIIVLIPHVPSEKHLLP